jgi:hypothetical protein
VQRKDTHPQTRKIFVVQSQSADVPVQTQRSCLFACEIEQNVNTPARKTLSYVLLSAPDKIAIMIETVNPAA